MEAREGMISGVTVIGAEAPSTYHVAPRNENPSQVGSSLAVAVSPMSVGLAGTSEKKKRGRPRKYGPDGPVTMTLSPMPISSSAPPSSNFSSGKQSTGRPSGLENKQQKKALKENLGELNASSMGTNFLPHIITVNAGEDVTMKVISFSQQGPRAICILSASGVISNVTLRQPDSSGGTLTYEGRFEILSLSGSYMPTESQGTKSRSGGLSVSLVSPTGRVVGGGVAGLLVAASPVQVVVGSFLPIDQHEQRPKKLKPESTPATSVPASTIPSGILASSEELDNAGGHVQNNSNVPKPNLVSSSSFQDIWANMHSVQDSRKTGTDINISLPGG